MSIKLTGDKNNQFLKSKHEVAAQNEEEMVFNILRTSGQDIKKIIFIIHKKNQYEKDLFAFFDFNIASL
jgi:hypothetical protein